MGRDERCLVVDAKHRIDGMSSMEVENPVRACDRVGEVEGEKFVGFIAGEGRIFFRRNGQFYAQCLRGGDERRRPVRRCRQEQQQPGV